MPEQTLIPPALPVQHDDVLSSYGDYVLSAYGVTALVLVLLVLRCFSRAKKAQRMHALLMQSEKPS